MTLSLPEGYAPPEGARPGEPFEAVATIKPDGNGGFTLLMIDGIEVGKEPSEEEKFAAKIPLPWDTD